MTKDINFRILDVKIDKITTIEVLEKIKGFLLLNDQHYIVTLNPEMIIEAQENTLFKSIINKANLVIPDGTGVLLAYKYIYHKKLPEKITGIDLIEKICKEKYINDLKIYLLGAKEGIAKKTSEILCKKYPNLKIIGAEDGIKDFMSDNYKIENDKLIKKINITKPGILFVAFGSPKQEIWISKNIKKMPSVKLAIGVGGSFDFISGKIKRAPKIFQRLGFEWLYRLFQEPKRIKRIYNATIKFGWIIIKNKKGKIPVL
ncbi:MAG: WecB/TagA/CpsF family glycosyltransferase [Patescibacteria group bacterium]|nr:WecB/TagA/CpsF family glycosyltransferase [Patescibacteria group bacterium]